MSIQQVFASGRTIGRTEAKAEQMVENAMGLASDVAEAGQQKKEQAVNLACGAMDMVKKTTSGAVGAVYDNSGSTEETEKIENTSGGALDTVKNTAAGAMGVVKNTASYAGETAKNTATYTGEAVKNTASYAGETVKNTTGMGN